MKEMITKPIVLTGIVLALILLAIVNLDKIKPINNFSAFDEDYVQYYKKACELKDKDACNELGDVYHYGKSGSVDLEDAVLFYKQACKLESPAGCNNIGYIYNLCICR